ncbi:hypothetical protein F3087_40220 [Nocardia colli]|uniref:Uncharacterized protein n=1 Tax=Nocardia colli TaxID=2545717 RepID=A0A5N0E0Z9_9NOCA|nr:hypothetical protein [Nocardia colli]KAA8881895.1 hypothetical protein F3087_40220 [Nocardia colli]
MKKRLLIVMIMGGIGLTFAIVAVIAGGIGSNVVTGLNDQCDSAIGPSGAGMTSPRPVGTPVQTGGARERSGGGTAEPTANPYAGLTFAPDDTTVPDWYRKCAEAMKIAPYQQGSLYDTNSGPAVDCARVLALAQLNSAAPAGATEASVQAAGAVVSRFVVYQASAAALTGRCAVEARADSTEVSVPAPNAWAVPDTAVTRNGCGTAAGSVASRSPAPTVLPATIADQGKCGLRVDLSAVSAGDLVFGGFRDNAPTEVGIAVDATDMVTSDRTGRFVLRPIADAGDVRVKRMLRSVL